jgi:hypothetical protein
MMKWIQLAYCILVVEAVVAAIMAILVRLTTRIGTWGHPAQLKSGLSDRASSTSGNESRLHIAMSHHIRTYSQLRQKIHNDLRLQHPEWVQPNGESPICDSYEARLMELIGALTRTDVECVQESPTI